MDNEANANEATASIAALINQYDHPEDIAAIIVGAILAGKIPHIEWSNE